ncbi:MAG: zinc ribbon domain-containing protein [Candidatus Eremiobacteraeota bacterium]|nr:zinc ribbon domain-containing protein [Candidatus Eremiobacteraeota bacterium]
MRLHALYCPGCGAPINPGDDHQVTCSYCGSVLVVQRFSVRQTSPGTPNEQVQSPLPAELSQMVTGRFELSLLDQVVPGAGPEWFRPLELDQGRFALAYLRLVDADGQSLARPSEDAFAVLTASLQEDSDPGLAAFLLLEHLVNQGFRERVETAILLFEPARSSVVTYNAGCPGCLLWVSQEEGRTVDLGRAYDALAARMLRETRDYFSNSSRLEMAADDLVVLVSAGYAGRGGGAYAGALGALSRSLNEHLGEHPLRVVTLAKNAFWKERAPAVQDQLPHSHLRVAAVRTLAATPLTQELAAFTVEAAPFEVALLRGPGDQALLHELHGNRAVLIWLAHPEGVSPDSLGLVTEAVLAVLDRPDHGDNENPRRAGREALAALGGQGWRLAVIQLLKTYERVKYFRHGWAQPLSLGPRGLATAEGMQQFDEGGQATVRPGHRLFFPGGLPLQGPAAKAEELAKVWPGGKCSALYQALVAHWRTRRGAPALARLGQAALGDGATSVQLEGMALVTNQTR